MATPTQAQIARQQSLSNILLQGGLGARPTTGLGALGALGQTLAGALLGRRATGMQEERQEAMNQALLALAGGQQTPPTAVAAAPPPAGPAMAPTSPMVPSPGPPALPPQGPQMAPGGGPGGGPSSPLAQMAGSPGPSTGVLGPLAGASGGASAVQLLQVAQQFPEAAAFLNPMISAAMTPQKPTVLSPGQVAVGSQGQVIARGAPKSAEFKTDLGKALADQRLAVETFGKDSPQAKAMGEIVSAERSGQTAVDLSDEAGQRKEFSRLSGDFIALRDAFGKIRGARDTAAGDLSLIFNYMKMLDPGSVVREGEFATAQNTAGVPERVRNTYNRLMTGERLSPNQRQNFKQQAGDVFVSQQRQQNLLEDQFRGLAGRSGLRPDNVVVDFQGDLRGFTSGGQGGEQQQPKFSSLDDTALVGTDTSNMSLEQLEAWNAEMTRRGL